jgi:phytoene dehydrogenase-like protein
MTEASSDTVGRHEPVLIVGAGVAGLCCARALHQAGIPCTIFESSDAVGGRVRTDIIETDDGTYALDRGFQAYLTAYPEGQRVLDYEALDLREFEPGALVFRDGRFHRVVDPLRLPMRAIEMLGSPITPVRDLIRLFLLDQRLRGARDEGVWSAPQQTTEALLRETGLDRTVIDGFFRPFFGGVFFDRTLRTSARMFRFTYSMFARGRTVVPACGMQRIPEQIAAGLDADVVRLDAPVERVDPRGIELRSGERIDARAVVVATDGANAARLIAELDPIDWQETTTIYFAAETPPIAAPILVLDGEGSGPVNHLAVPSNVSPEYAPRNRALICANVVGRYAPADDDATLEKAVRTQLTRWFGDQVRGWHHLRTYRIPHALPRQFPPALEEPQRPVRLESGIYICGDHRDNASINGAMESGRRAAEAVLRNLNRH